LCISNTKKTQKPQQLPKQGGLVRVLGNHKFVFIATHITQLFDKFWEICYYEGPVLWRFSSFHM